MENKQYSVTNNREEIKHKVQIRDFDFCLFQKLDSFRIEIVCENIMQRYVAWLLLHTQVVEAFLVKQWITTNM